MVFVVGAEEESDFCALLAAMGEEPLPIGAIVRKNA
jgi:hypothetical protein